MVSARITFVKKTYAFLDVEEDNFEEIEKKCDINNEHNYFEREWSVDTFRLPDSDWEIHEVDIEENYCVYGCGKKLDPDYDYENSCKECE